MTYSLLNSFKETFSFPTDYYPIVLHEPCFDGTNAKSYVDDCIDTGWVSTAGSWVKRFEDAISEYTGAKHVIAVTNGTVALRLALHCIGVRHNDEVLVSPLTFVASANAISHLGAVPHFVDIEPDTLGIDPFSLHNYLKSNFVKRGSSVFNISSGRRLAAILPVHIFGNPARILDLKSVADDWNLPIVEDAAEALGSWTSGIHCGLIGDLGCLSFNGNKIITTGGGGAVLTNNPELATLARHLSTTAKVPHSWDFIHDDIGWNDRMPNINAALGCSQMEQLPYILKLKSQLFEVYKNILFNSPSISLFQCQPTDISNNWLITVMFTENDILSANKSLHQSLVDFHRHQIFIRPCWKLLSELSIYSDSPSAPTPVAYEYSRRLLNLPSSPNLVHYL